MCLSNDYICDTIHNCPSGDDEKQKCGKWKVTIDSIDSDVSGDKLYQTNYPLEVIARSTATFATGSITTTRIQAANGFMWTMAFSVWSTVVHIVLAR